MADSSRKIGATRAIGKSNRVSLTGWPLRRFVEEPSDNWNLCLIIKYEIKHDGLS